MRWPLLTRRRPPGRLPSPGHDHDAGHLAYVDKVGPGGELWLRTKPFSAPPKDELARCLHTFAHVVDRLNLGLRSRVLDVGCGPGWLSELLARCGYEVTGIDISPDMVRIAEERIRTIPRPIGEGIDAPTAEFHAMPVLEVPWTDRFDAAVLYDTMHHFDDEVATLRAIHRSLVPGGRIYLEEGVRPPPGSEAERRLVAEMEEYGTLESPFDPEYLVDVLERVGFVDVIRHVRVDELYPIGSDREATARLARSLRYPDLNTVVASKPFTGADAKGAFRALIEYGGAWEERGPDVLFWLKVTNTGTSYWPTAAYPPFPDGVVTVGPYLPESQGGRRELPRSPLPHSVAAGEEVIVAMLVPRERIAAVERIQIDLVREGVTWFSEVGSQPLEIDVPI
jgi:SAM-dependent methyltransferase